MEPQSVTRLQSLLTLPCSRFSLGSSPRVSRVSYSSATEACPGLSPFTAEGYMDDQLITRYESHTRKMHPRVDWINTLEKEDFTFFNKYTRILQKDQEDFQEDVQRLQRRYNQSGGFHIVQMMIFCEVGEDGKRSGRWQYGYDGRHFLGYEMATGIWTAVDNEAQGIKQRAEIYLKQRFTDFLESICMEWLQKNDHYRSETSLREVPPVVTMSSRTEADGIERHVCRIHGFYPREIDASWTRDGEFWLQDTFHEFLAPNSDGTYYYSLGIQIDPKERGRYRCHVEHDGLQQPLDLALKCERLQGGKGWALFPESSSSLGLIIGVSVAGVILLCAICGILAFLRFRRGEDDPRNDPSRE
ncbi:hypothetical protein Chor_011674 [Crotalus horridus]